MKLKEVRLAESVMFDGSNDTHYSIDKKSQHLEMEFKDGLVRIRSTRTGDEFWTGLPNVRYMRPLLSEQEDDKRRSPRTIKSL